MKEYEIMNKIENRSMGFLDRAVELLLLDIDDIYKAGLDIGRERIRFVKYLDKMLTLTDGSSDKGKIQRLHEVLTQYSLNENQLEQSEMMLHSHRASVALGDSLDDIKDVGELTINQVIEILGGNLKLSDIK